MVGLHQQYVLSRVLQVLQALLYLLKGWEEERLPLCPLTASFLPGDALTLLYF